MQIVIRTLKEVSNYFISRPCLITEGFLLWTEVVETEPEDNEKEDEDLSEPHDETQYVKHTNKRSDANNFMIS